MGSTRERPYVSVVEKLLREMRAPGAYLHPKTVKHCLQAYGLWDE